MVCGPLLLAALLYSMSVVRTPLLYSAGYVLFHVRPCMHTHVHPHVYGTCMACVHVGFELMRVLCEAEGARCVASTRGCRGPPRFAAVSGVVTT